MSGSAEEEKHPIRVLVVDDSASARELLAYVLNGDTRLQVIGVASDGEQAVALAQRLRPDVITMDVHLPKLDGFAATRKIMETCPTRIVMVTASSIPKEVAAMFHALEAGALTVLAKPPGPGHPAHPAAAAELIQTVKLMAEVHIVKRWPHARSARHVSPAPRAEAVDGAAEIQLVVMGASTGGPLVLQKILERLPQNFAAPILIVQHISAGFAAGFAEWLGRASGYPTRLAVHGECPLPGMAYVAPDGLQMAILADRSIALLNEPMQHGLRPSVSCLFRSVAQAYGPRAAGVLLTGMGSDGAEELKLMQLAGAVTIAQNEETSIIYGMPGEAVKRGAATYVLPPEDIAAVLNRLVEKTKRQEVL